MKSLFTTTSIVLPFKLLTYIQVRKFELAVWGSDSIKGPTGALPLNLSSISPTDLKGTYDLFLYL